MKKTRRVLLLFPLFALLAVNALAQEQTSTQEKFKSDLQALAPKLKVRVTDLTPEQKAVLLRLEKADTEVRAFSSGPVTPEAINITGRELAHIYAQIVGDTTLLRYVIGEKMGKYFTIRETAKSAMQVSQVVDELNVHLQLFALAQNQALIEQNKRVIELLEQAAKKK